MHKNKYSIVTAMGYLTTLYIVLDKQEAVQGPKIDSTIPAGALLFYWFV